MKFDRIIWLIATEHATSKRFRLILAVFRVCHDLWLRNYHSNPRKSFSILVSDLWSFNTELVPCVGAFLFQLVCWSDKKSLGKSLDTFGQFIYCTMLQRYVGVTSLETLLIKSQNGSTGNRKKESNKLWKQHVSN